MLRTTLRNLQSRYFFNAAGSRAFAAQALQAEEQTPLQQQVRSPDVSMRACHVLRRFSPVKCILCCVTVHQAGGYLWRAQLCAYPCGAQQSGGRARVGCGRQALLRLPQRLFCAEPGAQPPKGALKECLPLVRRTAQMLQQSPPCTSVRSPRLTPSPRPSNADCQGAGGPGVHAVADFTRLLQ